MLTTTCHICCVRYIVRETSESCRVYRLQCPGVLKNSSTWSESRIATFRPPHESWTFLLATDEVSEASSNSFVIYEFFCKKYLNLKPRQKIWSLIAKYFKFQWNAFNCVEYTWVCIHKSHRVDFMNGKSPRWDFGRLTLININHAHWRALQNPLNRWLRAVTHIFPSNSSP